MSRFSKKNLGDIFQGNLEVKRAVFRSKLKGKTLFKGSRYPTTKYSDEDGSLFDQKPSCLWQLGKLRPFRKKRFYSVTGGSPRNTIGRVLRHNSHVLGLNTIMYRHKNLHKKHNAIKCVTLVTLYGPFITARLWRILAYGLKLIRCKKPRLINRGFNLLGHFQVKFDEFGVTLGTFSSMRKSGSSMQLNEHPEDVISSEESFDLYDQGDDDPDGSSSNSQSSDY